MKIKSNIKSFLFTLLLFGSMTSFIYLNFFATQKSLLGSEINVELDQQKYLPDLKIVTGIFRAVKKTMP